VYAQLKISNLKDICKLQIAKLMHPFKHGCLCLPSVFHNLFTKLDNMHIKIQSKKLQEYMRYI